MPKFKVKVEGYCIVEAEDKEDAEGMVADFFMESDYSNIEVDAEVTKDED